MHRRKLLIEEDEQRVKLEKDRIASIESRNIQMNKDLQELDTEAKKLRKENTDLFKEVHDQKEQLRVLNENLRRETELCHSRDQENKVLSNENLLLKQLLEETKSQGT
jgi:hypothetical protein